MSSKSTNVNLAADGQGVIVQGGSNYRGAGSVGGNVTSTSKLLDLTNAKTGNVTIGETGLGQTFAETVKSLVNSQTSALSALVPQTFTATAPVEPAPADPGPVDKRKLLFIGGGALLVLGLLWWFIKRK